MEDLIPLSAAAAALGVSDSTLKRWCDRGLLHPVRTVGGHRRLSGSEVIRFARESELPLRQPELLGLRIALLPDDANLADGGRLLLAALQAGDETQARAIVLNLFLRKRTIAELGDQVIAPALSGLGDAWACGAAEIYQERRACQIASRLLHDLRTALPALPAAAPRALGCTLPGDEYQVPTALAELCLLERGWRAESLGQKLPAANFARAIAKERPRLAWISVSHVENAEEFIAGIAELNNAATRAGTALVVGGRAVTAELRGRLRCASCCDNLAHLVCFAETQIDRVPEVRAASTVPG